MEVSLIKTVEEVLQAEDKIRIIQEEIESTEGRLKYLRDQTALSTLNVHMYQEVEYQAAPDTNKKPFLTSITESFGGGLELIQMILLGVIYLWPIWILLGVFLIWRKRRGGNDKR